MSVVEQIPLNTAGQVTLDASGNGRVQLSPSFNETWFVTNAAIYVSSANQIPQCLLYVGADTIPQNVVDTTFVGNQNASNRAGNYPITQGESIFAVWSGGDPGATATMSLIGTINRKMPN